MAGANGLESEEAFPATLPSIFGMNTALAIVAVRPDSPGTSCYLQKFACRTWSAQRETLNERRRGNQMLQDTELHQSHAKLPHA